MYPPRHIYLIGPMRGYPHYNFPMFDAAAAHLRAHGYMVHSPAEEDRKVGIDGSVEVSAAVCTERLAYDLALISTLQSEWDMVCLLPRWETSAGSLHELAHAIGCGLLVTQYATMFLP
jgi:hypothetical protein